MAQGRGQTYECYLRSYLENATHLAILLDYDGTLIPYPSNDQSRFIPNETKQLLERLKLTPGILIAIISGRDLEDLKDKVGIEDIVYVGNQGFDTLFADGTTYYYQLPENYISTVNEITKILEKEVLKEGAWIQNKGSSLTVHFIPVEENKRPEMIKKALELIENSNSTSVVRTGLAHNSINLTPRVEWNKGKAALMILEKYFGKNWRDNNVKVLFAGDDVPDEDAMEMLKGHAATFRISQSDQIETYAEMIVFSIKEVVHILEIIESVFENKSKI